MAEQSSGSLKTKNYIKMEFFRFCDISPPPLETGPLAILGVGPGGIIKI